MHKTKIKIISPFLLMPFAANRLKKILWNTQRNHRVKCLKCLSIPQSIQSFWNTFPTPWKNGSQCQVEDNFVFSSSKVHNIVKRFRESEEISVHTGRLWSSDHQCWMRCTGFGQTYAAKWMASLSRKSFLISVIQCQPHSPKSMSPAVLTCHPLKMFQGF